MAENNNFLEGTVLVEHSDDRLKAVEDAKRTGREFQSVGARGTDIVDRGTLAEAVREQSSVGSSDPIEPLPDYLVELRNTHLEDEQELNNIKAQEHHEYSAELAKAQDKARVSDLEKLRKDPDYFSRKIQIANAEAAEAFNKEAAEFARKNLSQAEQVREEVRALRPERVGDPHPVTLLGQNAKVTDISESQAAAALENKDRIIYGEESFKQQAKATEEPRSVVSETPKAAGEKSKSVAETVKD